MYSIEESNYYDNKEKVIRFAGLDDKSISLGVKEIKYKLSFG